MIQEIEEFSIYGVSVKTDEELESDLNSSLIFPLWKKFHSIFGAPDEIYSVYYDYKNTHKLEYKICIKGGKYMLFEDSGKPEIIAPKLWQNINEFFKNSSLQRKFDTDFEFYTTNKTQIYISMKE
ncbi:GyrI-like domain-containing protein [Campylobacter coli]|uniref:GyrI-like domain-containing protein n=1 Tax=Campylobacter coli TaxID=195 RepID=UPI0012BE9BE6|nr:GyrI-like domain-containing protein [Campylobacter coli]EDP5934492.1 GyrI-like domain-containing protein [Campylobacter jejuni]ECK7771042.1 GyrI-like domain-containing protein [Campylobacter coli]ECL2538571.1 GyrI-like domain-containing protein [Campylobacter coli]ECL2905554.1 GyrI-like domain-containing protein [Campylobacter coli]ECO2837333.1 GyrI-like domain-containing protein [Campylobacter coli]